MKLILTYDCQYGFKELYMTETDCEFDVGSRLLGNDFMVLQAVLTDPKMKKDFKEDPYFFSEHLKDIYEEYKTSPMKMFVEENEDGYGLFDGELECLESITLEDAYHNIFKKLVGEFPGYFRMYNCRLELDESEEESCLNFADGTKLYLKDILELKNKILKDELTDEEIIDLTKAVTTQIIETTYFIDTKEIDSATACDMLGISRQTLANWVKAGKLTRNANGKYDLEEINKLLKK